MSEKKVGKRLLTWVLVLVMTLSLLPLNVLAAGGPETDSSSGMDFDKRADSNGDGTYTITMTAQATGTTTTKAVPMDIVLVLDQSGSMKDSFGNGTRQSAMKEAVNSFIGEVAAKYSTEADHRMAIVTFGTNADPLVGWTAVDEDGEVELTSKIGNLKDKPSGATNVEAGMTETQSLMSNAPTGQNRQKTVIVFTDGVPTTQRDFDTDVANKAISAAKSMKGSGVTIYTVGIFKGADPKQLHGDKWSYVTENDVPCSGEPGSYWGGSWLEHLFGGNDFAPIDVPAGNRFLNYLSSNSANASEIGITKDKYNPGNVFGGRGDGWRIDNNADCTTNKGYYMTASDASSLKNIFKVISNTVPEPVNDKLDEETVITDTLSDYFTFADVDGGDVKVYAEKRDGTTYPITDGIDVNGKTVTVTGYDFSKHYQGIGGDAEETLVIKIKVKPDPTATWRASDDYETNEGNATVTLPNIEKPIAEAASPKVHVDTYKVTYQPGTGTGNEYTDQYYLNGAKTPVKANTFTAPDGYKFDCWKDDNDTTYQVGADITFDKSDVTLTAQWKEIEAQPPTLVTLTANSMTVTYDGQPHDGSPYSCDDLGLLPGHTVESVDYTCEPQTNVGTYDIKLNNAKIVDADSKDVTALYQITYNYGKLIIDPCDVTVTIKGNTKTVYYNGKEQSVKGYTVSIDNNLYKEADFALKNDAKAEAKGTKVGTYPMGLTKESFENTNKNFTNVVFVVNDGYLEITRSGGHHPRPKPTVEIEDDDALGLNTTDHFAYIVGYGNGEVRPQNNITRAEVATIFFRLLTDDVRDENLTKTNRYSDVTRADWYNTAVSTLSSMGIITGYPDGTFRPNAAITRAEFAAITARFDNDGDKTAAKFSDIATHWAKDEISIAYNNGWITGYPDGTFGPQRDITRAETMTLVNRVLNRQPETEEDLLPNMTVWTDNANPNAWYYLAVQEATNSHYYKFKTNSKYEKWTELRETRDWTLLEK